MSVIPWQPGVILEPIDLTPPVIQAIKNAFTPAQTLAITIWREAEARLESGHWIANPMAAMLDVLATPGSSADAMAIDEASHARWAARLQAANETAEQDAVFALDAMVTRDGRLANFHRLRTHGHKDELNLIEALSDTVTRARIDPGAIDASQVPANSTMVWLVTRTTVRASKSITVDLPLPPAAKKRTVARSSAPVPLARA